MKRLLMLCGITAMLLSFSYQSARATSAKLPQPEPLRSEVRQFARLIVKSVIAQESRHGHRVMFTCGSTCEDRMEEAVTSCLGNGGGDWCWGAALSVYCQCMYVECGAKPDACSTLLP